MRCSKLWLCLCLFLQGTEVHGRLLPTRPTQNSVHTAGGRLHITWDDDSHRPSLDDTGPMNINLYAGNRTYVRTLAGNASPTTRSISVNIPLDLPFSVADYTLRFVTDTPSMTIYSANFVIVSSSGPSIAMEPSNARPPSAARTVTVTKTNAVTPAVTRTVTLTRLAGETTQEVSPSRSKSSSKSTFFQIVDGSLALETEAADTTTVRAYPIFISRVASTSHSTSATATMTSMDGVNTTTSGLTSSTDTMTALISTSVAKPSPSALRNSRNSATTMVSSFTLFGWFSISVVAFMYL